MPAERAASRSMWSTPTVTAEMIRSRSASPAITSAVTGLSPTSSASAPAAGGEHVGRCRGDGGAHREALGTQQISALAAPALHRVNIHGRCRISNHWCILGSACRDGKPCCTSLASMVRIGRGFVDDATTRRAPQASAPSGAVVLALPGFAWTTIFFLAPLALLLVYSFGQINIFTFQVDWGWTLDNYRNLDDRLYLDPIARSLVLSVGATAALPADRVPRRALDQPALGTGADARARGGDDPVLVVVRRAHLCPREPAWRRRAAGGPAQLAAPVEQLAGDPVHADGDRDRHRLQLPAADDPPPLRGARADRSVAAGCGLRPRRRRPSGLPPGGAAAGGTGDRGRLHPRRRAGDRRVHDPGDPRRRQDADGRQRDRRPVPQDRGLPLRLGARDDADGRPDRHPDPRAAAGCAASRKRRALRRRPSGLAIVSAVVLLLLYAPDRRGRRQQRQRRRVARRLGRLHDALVHPGDPRRPGARRPRRERRGGAPVDGDLARAGGHPGALGAACIAAGAPACSTRRRTCASSCPRR